MLHITHPFSFIAFISHKCGYPEKDLLPLSSLLEWRRKCRWHSHHCPSIIDESHVHSFQVFSKERKGRSVNLVTLKCQIVNLWNEWLWKMGRSSKLRSILAARWISRRENFLSSDLCYRYCSWYLSDEHSRHLYKLLLVFHSRIRSTRGQNNDLKIYLVLNMKSK